MDIGFREIRISCTELRVWFQCKPVHFTLAELRLLVLFALEPDTVFTREQLMERADVLRVSELLLVITHMQALLNEQYIHMNPDTLGYSMVPVIQQSKTKWSIHASKGEVRK